MNEIGIIATAIAVFALIITLTKSIWQWILGTDKLIEEAQDQTDLLEKIYKQLKNMETKEK